MAYKQWCQQAPAITVGIPAPPLTLTGAGAVLKVDMALLKGIAEIKFLGDSSLKLVIDSMTALASVLALKATLGSVTFVFTEGTGELWMQCNKK